MGLLTLRFQQNWQLPVGLHFGLPGHEMFTILIQMKANQPDVPMSTDGGTSGQGE